jgi:HEAT repeat protein
LASGAGPILNACAGKPEPDYWIKRLTAPDPRTRSLAANALGEMRARTAVAALIRALEDGDAHVRRAVVEALGRIGPDAKAAVSALTRALSDDDPEVRAKARQTLERIGAR